MNNTIFYNLSRVLSYNCFINILIGERGVGKTFSVTEYVIDRFKKYGDQFIYLRRYKTELKAKDLNKFFDSVKKIDKYKNDNFEYKNECFYINDQLAGGCKPLSTSRMQKGINFDNIKTIMFDEFIINKGVYHYLQDEVETFLDFLETVGRLRNIKVFMLGNAISTTNPYFTYFNLKLPYNSDIATYKNNTILVNYIENKPYREVKKKSTFGKLIEGTPYEKYAIDNEFIYDNKAFIKKRDKNSIFFFILYLNGNKYGVWENNKINELYISKKYNDNDSLKIALNTKDHDTSSILLIVKKSIFLQNLLEHYRLGTLYFDNQQIKNELMPFIERYINR